MESGREDEGPEPPALSEDEAAFRASLALLVDWYRVSQLPTLAYAFVPAMLLFVPLGGALISLSNLPSVVHPSLAAYAVVAGVLIMAAGPVWCAFTLVRAIRSDAYVAIRVDGLALRLDGEREERLIAWADLEDVHYDSATQRTLLGLHDREPCVIRARFAEVSLEELTRRIKDARRLAVWERLSPRTGQR